MSDTGMAATVIWTQLLKALRSDFPMLEIPDSSGPETTKVINALASAVLPPATENGEMHYYAFAFSHGAKTGSVYMGYPDKKVSVARIDEAKAQATMPADSVLISLGYMGYMSHQDVLELR